MGLLPTAEFSKRLVNILELSAINAAWVVLEIESVPVLSFGNNVLFVRENELVEIFKKQNKQAAFPIEKIFKRDVCLKNWFIMLNANWLVSCFVYFSEMF